MLRSVPPMALLKLLPILACFLICHGLRCYETDEQGRISASSDSSHLPLCVLSSNAIDYNQTTPFRTNLEIEDVRFYKQILSQGRSEKGRWRPSQIPSYAVLTACVIERYYIGDGLVDYSFRCFCGHDYCNEKTDMLSFLRTTVENDKKSLPKRRKTKL